jgi:hypothetical protein
MLVRVKRKMKKKLLLKSFKSLLLLGLVKEKNFIIHIK